MKKVENKTTPNCKNYFTYQKHGENMYKFFAKGETELDYFCELARSLSVNVHICKGDGKDPKRSIKELLA